MAWTLCSKDDVASLHPITLGEIKDEWSDMVEGLIRQHMGQPNLGSTVAITDEYHSGDGSYVLRVRKPPIYSVEALEINSTAMLASDYVVFSDHIELFAGTFPKGVLNVKISYTSGTATIDPTVTLAAAAMIVAIINYRKRYGADSSLKWGIDSTEQKAGENTPNLNVGLTSHLTTIMKRVLRRPYVRVK